MTTRKLAESNQNLDKNVKRTYDKKEKVSSRDTRRKAETRKVDVISEET